MALNDDQDENITYLSTNKFKIVQRIKELKDTRDKLVSLFGKDPYHSIIFNHLTDTINSLFGQVQLINTQIDRVRVKAGLKPLYDQYAELYGKRTG